MTITITAFERSPDGGQGLARDTRVRWALEEAGLPYEVRALSFGCRPHRGGRLLVFRGGLGVMSTTLAST